MKHPILIAQLPYKADGHFFLVSEASALTKDDLSHWARNAIDADAQAPMDDAIAVSRDTVQRLAGSDTDRIGHEVLMLAPLDLKNMPESERDKFRCRLQARLKLLNPELAVTETTGEGRERTYVSPLLARWVAEDEYFRAPVGKPRRKDREQGRREAAVGRTGGVMRWMVLIALMAVAAVGAWWWIVREGGEKQPMVGVTNPSTGPVVVPGLAQLIELTGKTAWNGDIARSLDEATGESVPVGKQGELKSAIGKSFRLAVDEATGAWLAALSEDSGKKLPGKSDLEQAEKRLRELLVNYQPARGRFGLSKEDWDQVYFDAENYALGGHQAIVQGMLLRSSLFAKKAPCISIDEVRDLPQRKLLKDFNDAATAAETNFLEPLKDLRSREASLFEKDSRLKFTVNQKDDSRFISLTAKTAPPGKLMKLNFEKDEFELELPLFDSLELTLISKKNGVGDWNKHFTSFYEFVSPFHKTKDGIFRANIGPDGERRLFAMGKDSLDWAALREEIIKEFERQKAFVGVGKQ